MFIKRLLIGFMTFMTLTSSIQAIEEYQCPSPRFIGSQYFLKFRILSGSPKYYAKLEAQDENIILYTCYYDFLILQKSIASGCVYKDSNKEELCTNWPCKIICGRPTTKATEK